MISIWLPAVLGLFSIGLALAVPAALIVRKMGFSWRIAAGVALSLFLAEALLPAWMLVLVHAGMPPGDASEWAGTFVLAVAIIWLWAFALVEWPALRN